MENEIIIACDKNDVIIQIDDRVIWTDPETKNQVEYKVWDIHNEELIKLSNDNGECEALPEECEVIWDKDKVNRWVDECAGGFAFELLDEGGFPFTEKELKQIAKVEYDESVTDSELCDYILEVAYKHLEEV